MKPIKLLPLLIIFVVSACQIDPSYTRYYNAVIFLDNRIVPENATVNVPLNIYASTSVYNNCWSNINFVFKEDRDYEYSLYAIADFESYGTCSELTTSADNVITMTPETTGNYVITVWTNGSTYERDTIKVEEPIL